MSLAVFRLYVYPVELVGVGILIRLALQQLHNPDLLSQQHRDESLKDSEVAFVAKHMLHHPVKPYIRVVFRHIITFSTNITRPFRYHKFRFHHRLCKS